jgi:hypothetical protein
MLPLRLQRCEARFPDLSCARRGTQVGVQGGDGSRVQSAAQHAAADERCSSAPSSVQHPACSTQRSDATSAKELGSSCRRERQHRAPRDARAGEGGARWRVVWLMRDSLAPRLPLCAACCCRSALRAAAALHAAALRLLRLCCAGMDERGSQRAATFGRRLVAARLPVCCCCCALRSRAEARLRSSRASSSWPRLSAAALPCGMTWCSSRLKSGRALATKAASSLAFVERCASRHRGLTRRAAAGRGAPAARSVPRAASSRAVLMLRSARCARLTRSRRGLTSPRTLLFISHLFRSAPAAVSIAPPIPPPPPSPALTARARPRPSALRSLRCVPPASAVHHVPLRTALPHVAPAAVQCRSARAAHGTRLLAASCAPRQHAAWTA